jgi:hypothetical protein
LADSKGWFKVAETTPAMVFWEKAKRDVRRKMRRNLGIFIRLKS